MDASMLEELGLDSYIFSLDLGDADNGSLWSLLNGTLNGSGLPASLDDLYQDFIKTE